MASPTRSPSQTPLLVNCLCAGTAAAVATGLFNPLDTLRVRWQMIPVVGASSVSGCAVASASLTASATSSIARFGGAIIAAEGLVAGLWRPGCAATMLSMATSCSVRMGSYPFVRDWVAGRQGKTPTIMFGTGLVCGAVGYWVSCPFFQTKTQLQAASVWAAGGGSHGPLGVARHLAEIWGKGGAAALFRGSSALVVRGATLSAGQTLGYDGAKTALAQRNQIMQDGPALHVVGSVVASFFATVASAPADLVMTRYQAAPQVGMAYTGPLDCFGRVLREEGLRGFYRGWWPYFVRLSPVFIIFHPLFEQLRFVAGLNYMN